MKVRDRVVPRSGAASLVGLSVVSVLQAAMAGEPADEPRLEEVTVTAERRETSERTTAISMNVITGEELASKRTQNIADLQQTTPNVTINQSGLFNSINIRGIGNSAIQPSITTGVAVFQDGLLNAETITLGGAFLDLGSVEVLRGPQGTFVGASSTGGAIRLNSMRPSLDGRSSGYVEALVGTKSDVKVTGAINLPLSSTFAARLAFNAERRDSYFTEADSGSVGAPINPFTRQGSVDDKNARISLLWHPNDNFDAIWRSEANRVNHEGSPYQPNPRTFTNALGQQTHSRYWNYDDPTHDTDVLYMNTPETRDIGIVERHSLELNYMFANQMRLRSLSGFVHNENQYIEDQDGSAANANVFRNNVGPNNNYYIQELNLISAEGPFNWIVGASGFYRRTPVNLVTETYTCGIDPVDGSFTPCPLQATPGGPPLVFVNSSTTVRSGGIFGQVNWSFIEKLELTAGARMNYDRNFSGGQGKGDSVAVVIPVPAGIVPGTVPCVPDVQASLQIRGLDPATQSCLRIGQRATYKDNTPTWKVGLNWQPTDRDFMYLFWSRGYKSGGVDQQGQFDAEQVDDYEIGWKGTFLDGHARLSLGGFWMDYQNMQQAAYKASTITAGQTVYNIGSSTLKGVELEFNALAGGFGLNATAGYTDSQIDTIRVIDRQSALDSAVRLPGSPNDLRQCEPGVTPATAATPCVDWTPYYVTVSNVPNLYSPKVSYSASIDYELTLASGGKLTPRVGVSHTHEQDTNLVRRSAFYSIPARTLLSASVTYTMDDWLVQAYCNNCSDKTYIASVQSDQAWNNVLYGNPRNFGVRVRRNF